MILLIALIDLYTFIIIGRAISSFFPIGSDSPFAPVVSLLYRLTEPVFAPVRRVLPQTGMIDLAPLVVLLGLNIVVRRILVAVL
jgi:YggT family protein